MDINNLTWVQQYGLKSEQYSLTELLTSMKCPPIFSQHTFLNKINNYTVTQSFLWSILLCIHSAMYILIYFFYICKSCISLVCKNIFFGIMSCVINTGLYIPSTFFHPYISGGRTTASSSCALIIM